VLNDQDQPCTRGEVGELCVRGSSLALGYWRDPERTAAVFVQNPLHQHYAERIYRTGDLVTLNSRDELVYAGRKDAQIKHMGYRIELGEIEHAALALPEVDNGCALYDQARREIVFFYEAAAALTPAQFRGALRRSLPTYMLPKRYLHLEELPLNANGKLNRRLLAQTHLEGAS
jgi:acyl-CoA synthetase (AMP-forming)/AMP-acid ligase II